MEVRSSTHDLFRELITIGNANPNLNQKTKANKVPMYKRYLITVKRAKRKLIKAIGSFRYIKIQSDNETKRTQTKEIQ